MMAGHWVVAWVIYFLQRSSLMLGHHLDACASHLMRRASYVMLCASCLMLGHRFDACASCVEPGAPWVTEASSFAVIFHFFQSLALSWYSSLHIWIPQTYLFISHWMDCWMSWLYGLCT